MFGEPWVSSNEKPRKLKIEEDLGESEEIITNEDGSQGKTIIHRYKVKEL